MTWIYKKPSSYIYLQNQTLNLKANFTISLWYYNNGKDSRSSDSSKTYILSTSSGATGFNLQVENSGNNTRFTLGSDLPAGCVQYMDYNFTRKVWYYLALMVNWTELNFYVNGNRIYSNSTYFQSGCSIVTNNPSQLDLGDGYPYGSYGNASFDEIRIYNNYSSDEQILSLYNQNRYRNETFLPNYLIAYLPMNEYSDIITYNLKNPIFNASLIGSPIWQSDNINVTSLGYWVNISITGMSNSLVFYKNYTLINASMSGSKNFEFYNNDTIYILDNFNVTEGVSVVNSPIWFSSSTSTIKKFVSNLSEQINESVTINVDNCRIATSSYTPFGDIISYPTSTCSDNKLTFLLLNINPGGDNELDITYSDIPLCTDGQTVGYMLIKIVLSLALIGGILFFVYRNGSLFSLSIGEIIILFIAIMVSIGLISSIVNIMAGSCT
jgi:hypothetical protein